MLSGSTNLSDGSIIMVSRLSLKFVVDYEVCPIISVRIDSKVVVVSDGFSILHKHM